MKSEVNKFRICSRSISVLLQSLVWLGSCEDDKVDLTSTTIKEMVEVTCDNRRISPSAIKDVDNLHDLGY
jgi:hypothetical protein